MTVWAEIESAITQSSGQNFCANQRRSVGGGCINQAYRIAGNGNEYFVKLNHAEQLGMFEAEADGLREILRAGGLSAPQPVCTGLAGQQSFIVMEDIGSGRGRPDPRTFAAQLASLHHHCADRYGWFRDNTIGATPQHNDWNDSWIDFWRNHRLGFQLDLCERQGQRDQLQDLGARLMADLKAFFSGYVPAPSLLHGDLWSGNYGTDRAGNPVIFDPAVYYGDREADLAMTELFGGFDREFYAAYSDAWPLDLGYAVRKDLYNLYHVLNHLNLFGGGYRSQAVHLLEKLLAEVN